MIKKSKTSKTRYEIPEEDMKGLLVGYDVAGVAIPSAFTLELDTHKPDTILQVVAQKHKSKSRCKFYLHATDLLAVLEKKLREDGEVLSNDTYFTWGQQGAESFTFTLIVTEDE